MKILNEHGRWWKGVEKEWAVEDKDGNWWIYRNKGKENMKIERKRSAQHSLRPPIYFYLSIVLAALLGISLAANVVYCLM